MTIIIIIISSTDDAVMKMLLVCCRDRVKLLLEMSAEDPMAIIESFSTQLLQEDVLPLTSRDFAAVVDTVTTDDVNRVGLVCSLVIVSVLHCAVMMTINISSIQFHSAVSCYTAGKS